MLCAKILIFQYKRKLDRNFLHVFGPPLSVTEPAEVTELAEVPYPVVRQAHQPSKWPELLRSLSLSK